MSEPYQELANHLQEAIDSVNSARAVRDSENIENFRDLDSIVAELQMKQQQASMTRFK